jgi:hypothetical protein
MKIPVIIPFYKDCAALNKAKDFLKLQTVPTEAALKVQVQQFSKGNCLCQELTITSNLRKEL